MEKPFYKSKTLLFSILFVLVSIANLAGFAEFDADPALVGLFEAVVFAVLRFKTSTSLALDKGQ